MVAGRAISTRAGLSVNSLAILTPSLKFPSALISLRKIGIEGVIFRVQA